MAFDVFLQQAIIFHNEGRLDEAENLYQKALSMQPNSDFVLNLLGLVAQQKGFDLLAIDYFYKALYLQPFSQEYNFSLAYSLDNLGRYNEAVEHYQKASSVKEALNNIGNIYKKLGKADEAKKYYKKALEKDDKYFEPKVNLAFLDMDIKTLKTFDDHFLANYYLALIYFDKKESDEALACLDKIIEDFDYVYALKAEIEFYLKNYQKSYENAQKTLKINKNNPKALFLAANVDTINKNYDNAEKTYLRAIELEPKNINIIINYANMLYVSGNKAKSLEEYRKAILIDDKNVFALNNLAIIIKEAKEYDEALGLFFLALNIEPDNEDLSVNILETLILFADENKDDAKKIAKNWQKSYPDNEYAKHLVASFDGIGASNDVIYSQKLFDAFVLRYEDVLAKIDYALPQKAKEIFGNIKGSILDLGCGSGLLGELIKNDSNNIIGIDVSSKMLELAKAKNVYDDLKCVDAETYLSKKNDFDYVFALDVFCYISDLSNLINALKTKKFFFSVEKGGDKDVELQINGRYKHSKKYIESFLCDVEYCVEEMVIRKENNKNVIGLVYYKK